MSSYISNDEPSKNEDDDLKLSQTKMDAIREENEEQENELFNNFINKTDRENANQFRSGDQKSGYCKTSSYNPKVHNDDKF